MAGSSTDAASPPPSTVAVQQEIAPRVEIGEAVLTIYDERGHVVSVE